jgi:ATP-binding protein involved in chromosome partitioning
MLTNDDVLKALADVAGPDGRTPLTETGLVAGISIRDDKICVALNAAPELAQALEPMRVSAEAALKALPGASSALVVLTSESKAEDARQKPAAAPPRSGGGVDRVRQIVAVASGKGGVGKSTTACNLALALSRLGMKVGVLDADVYGPSMPRLFGLHTKPVIGPDGHSLLPLEKFGIKVMSIGFLVEDDAPIIWRGPMVMSALTQLLRDVDWGELDVLVVDMPPGTGDAQLTIAQNVPLAGAVLVSTPQDLALLDTRRGAAMFRQVDVPLLGIIENMSYFLCPHCGGRSDVFAHGGASCEAEKLGVPFLGEIPLDIVIRETSDGGVPVVAGAPEGPHAAAYLAIAERVSAALRSPVRADASAGRVGRSGRAGRG